MKTADRYCPLCRGQCLTTTYFPCWPSDISEGVTNLAERTQVLDQSVVARLVVDVGDSVLPGLFRVFVEEIKQINAQLQHTDDEQALARLAHKLKGAAGNYGAERLRLDAGSLEHSARAGGRDLSLLKQQVSRAVEQTAESARELYL